MARTDFTLPDIGEGIAEAEIVEWLVEAGQAVDEGQPLVAMMTDKATIELEAPVAGTVAERRGEVGDRLPIGTLLVVLEGDEAGGSPPAPAPDVAEPETAERPVAGAPVVAAPAPSPPPAAGSPVRATPAVRARAKALGIDLAAVRHAGPHVRHADLDAFLLARAGDGYGVPMGAERPDEAIRVIGMRRRIAERMAEAKRHIPHFTYVEEVDMTALEAMRGDFNAEAQARPRLTVLPFLIAAICRALPGYPMLNARYDDAANIVTRYGAVHMGIATQTDAGLVVPVVHDAHRRNLWQLAEAIAEVSAAARSGKARPEQLSGATITLTSLGKLGGIATTPIVNWPEVAIIGPNRLVRRPVVLGDTIAIRDMMNISISCDHRVVDGHDAASFMQELKRMLETPALLFVPD